MLLGQSSGWGLGGISSNPITSGIFSWWELASSGSRWREREWCRAHLGETGSPSLGVQRLNHLLSFQLLTPAPGRKPVPFWKVKSRPVSNLVKPPGSDAKTVTITRKSNAIPDYSLLEKKNVLQTYASLHSKMN